MLLTVVVILAAVAICVVGKRVADSNRAVVKELRELRLTSRAKVSTMKARSGPLSEEQKLIRHGRATRSKLVVFGGDPLAPQHTNLGKSLPEGEPR